MISKLSKKTAIIFIGIISFELINTIFTPSTHAASVCSQPQDSIPAEVWQASGCDNDTDDKLPQIIVSILNAIILVSGLVATVFVLIGGINYMTSAGDPSKVEKAKKTIIYACIGLAICALSFAIVNFTITNIIGGKTSSGDDDDDNEDTSLQLLHDKPIA